MIVVIKLVKFWVVVGKLVNRANLLALIILKWEKGKLRKEVTRAKDKSANQFRDIEFILWFMPKSELSPKGEPCQSLESRREVLLVVFCWTGE